jgi:phospholipase C
MRSVYFLVVLCVCSVIGCCLAENTPPRIKHIVVLMEENRPFDHLFGWASDLLGVNGLTGEEYNLVDPENPSSEKIYVSDKAPLLNDCDPNHGVPATTSKLFSTSASQISGVPDMGGFVAFENSSTALNYCNVMQGFPPSKVPVLTSLAQNYAIMDRFFASVPGPTWPNRMFALSGTSAGSTSTSIWYHNEPGKLYPQKTFYDQIEESGNTWKNYFNDTPWELILEKVAHSPHNLHPLDQFYADAKAGTLPSFSWINPRSGMNVTTGVGSNDQHPDHDVSAGEQYYKDIYEALRASPAWEDTLFIVTYDEHGGFYDHVVPPTVNIPTPGDGEAAYPDTGFKFDRLGIRVPTLLISPWIKAGTVISSPPSSGMPASNSEYDLTSIIATARKLLPGMENVGPLTGRDAWSATFEHVLFELDQPRTDCPLHLPDALVPELPNSKTFTPESDLPINDLQIDISNIHSFLGHGEKVPELQGDLSEWLVRQHGAHKSKTTEWLASKASPNATVTVKPRPDYKGALEDSAWDMNGLPYGSVSGQYANSKSPYIVLSTRTLRRSTSNGKEEPFCLDAGEGKEGSRLKATACYPSQNPDLNRDPMQHWVLMGDGTLRLFDAKGKSTLCVTNHLFDAYERRGLKVDAAFKARSLKSGYSAAQEVATLEVCNDSVQQTFAYHGHAPGDNGAGNLEFGDVEFYLGVVKAA